MQKLFRLQSTLHSFEDSLLFVLVLGMLCLSITQIFLRNFFDFGIVWAEALTRLIVLWTTMIGSMVAARASKHIRIDIIERYGRGKTRDAILGLVQLLTAILCLLLVYFSMKFLLLEYEDGTEAFANIPNWIFITILPICFTVMGIRYLLNATIHFLGTEI